MTKEDLEKLTESASDPTLQRLSLTANIVLAGTAFIFLADVYPVDLSNPFLSAMVHLFAIAIPLLVASFFISTFYVNAGEVASGSLVGSLSLITFVGQASFAAGAIMFFWSLSWKVGSLAALASIVALWVAHSHFTKLYGDPATLFLTLWSAFRDKRQ